MEIRWFSTVACIVFVIFLGCDRKKEDDNHFEHLTAEDCHRYASELHDECLELLGTVNGDQKTTALLLKQTPMQSESFLAHLQEGGFDFHPIRGLGPNAKPGFTWLSFQNTNNYLTNDENYIAEFNPPENMETECRLNDGKWKKCYAEYQTKLGQNGIYVLQVRSIHSNVILGALRWRFSR